MLRIAIHPSRESILVVAQTRDRGGNVADASSAGDGSLFGSSPQLGYAGQASIPGTRWPQLDIDRIGVFDAILFENDIDTSPGLPAFYDYSAELSDPVASREVPWPPLDPDDDTQTLWAYFGSEFQFRSAYLKVALAGSYDDGSIVVEYWNGAEWASASPTEGSRLDVLRGLDDQVSWEAPGDWFPTVVGHQQATVEGSRKVVSRELFWVRMKLADVAAVVTLPKLAGAWEGDPGAEDDPNRWPLVTAPEKIVLARCPMVRDPNAHLSAAPVASRKAPAHRLTGRTHLGRGDYYLRVPCYYAEDPVEKNPALATTLVSGQSKTGTGVTVPVSAESVVMRPGRYRARVYGEIPNVDANIYLSAAGHTPAPPDPDLVDPGDPESQYDPSWMPVMSGVCAHFDVRMEDAFAQVEMQRNALSRDAYVIWLRCGGRRVPLVNQGGVKDYARLQVTDAYTGAVLIDTADGAKSVTGGPITAAAAPAGSPDPHLFRYTETDNSRKLQDRGQYLLTATIVRGGEAVVSTTSISFFSSE